MTDKGTNVSFPTKKVYKRLGLTV